MRCRTRWWLCARAAHAGALPTDRPFFGSLVLGCGRGRSADTEFAVPLLAGFLGSAAVCFASTSLRQQARLPSYFASTQADDCAVCRAIPAPHSSVPCLFFGAPSAARA